MSGYFSSKAVAAREALARGPIDDDIACPICGYNLRGLTWGRACPECGSIAQPSRWQGIGDALAAADVDQRAALRLGFGLGALCVLIALSAKILFTAWSIFGGAAGSGWLISTYVIVVLANSAVWVWAVWLMTPAHVDKHLRIPRVRRTARVLAWGFPAGFALLAAVRLGGMAGGPAGDTAWAIALALRLAGGVGVVFLLAVVERAAIGSELEDEARRSASAMWLLWIPTVLLMVFPSTMAWFTIVPLGMVMFFWAWLMIAMARALYGIHSHLRWMKRHAHDALGRDERIVQKRAAMDAELQGKIRPLPNRGGGDVPMG